MYSTILSFHSLFRWVVLASLLFAVYRAYRGWYKGKEFSSFDNTVRHTTATIAHIQLLLGLTLYFTSPVVSYFWDNFKDAIHDRESRFFGMEHSLMMFISIVLITIGSAKAKRVSSDKGKFKTMAIYFSIALLLILGSIPWGFPPLVSRPYFRTF